MTTLAQKHQTAMAKKASIKDMNIQDGSLNFKPLGATIINTIFGYLDQNGEYQKGAIWERCFLITETRKALAKANGNKEEYEKIRQEQGISEFNFIDPQGLYEFEKARTLPQIIYDDQCNKHGDGVLMSVKVEVNGKVNQLRVYDATCVMNGIDFMSDLLEIEFKKPALYADEDGREPWSWSANGGNKVSIRNRVEQTGIRISKGGIVRSEVPVQNEAPADVQSDDIQM